MLGRVQLVMTFVTTIFLFSSCGKQISNFVGSKSKAPEASTDDAQPKPPTNPVATVNKAIKLSPGSGVLKGQNVQGKMTITTTGQKLKGTHVDAQLSISQNRVN